MANITELEGYEDLVRQLLDVPEARKVAKEMFVLEEQLGELTIQERLHRLTAKDLMNNLPEETIREIFVEVLLKSLTIQERLRGLTAQDILVHLPEEVLEELKSRLLEL